MPTGPFFPGVVINLFWNHEYSFVPLNGPRMEYGSLAVCGERWGCGWLSKIPMTMLSYTKRCVKMRGFWWYKFGRNRRVSSVLICVLVWLSWNFYVPKTNTFPPFWLSHHYNPAKMPWIVLLSLHMKKCWDIISMTSSLPSLSELRLIRTRRPSLSIL